MRKRILPDRAIGKRSADKVHPDETVVQLNLAHAERLDTGGAEFYYPAIEAGQDVSIGIGAFLGDEFFIHCDFEEFEEKLRSVNPEMLEKKFQEVGELLEQLPHLDREERRFIHACWRAARIARNLLGEVFNSERERVQAYVAAVQKSSLGRPVGVRKLSDTRGKAMCAEISVLTHHVLGKAGLSSAVVIGAVSDHQEDTNGAHAYLVMNDGKRVFDPTVSNQRKDSWPPAILDAEKPMTVENLRYEEDGNLIDCTDIITGQKRRCGTGIGQWQE